MSDKTWEAAIGFIERVAPDLMEKGRIPGLSITVVKDGDVVYAGGFGARNVEQNLSATPDTLYGIGSCTKSFVALAIMQLAKQGKISLDDRASKYTPLKIGMSDKPITLLAFHPWGRPP
jgi:CubicO group peptidase (beta-lactamase class C family)